ncbi:MAG: ATP-binding cassette domain-containing protein [Marinosulfonomonas sp.]
MAKGLFPLTVENLRLDTDGRRLIDIAELSVSEGGPTIILGPNGAGKSLLLRLLHGLIVPTSGRIEFNGQPIGAEVQRRQAMVFQKPVLLRRSVAENVNFVLKVKKVPAAERKARVTTLLSEGGLAGKADQSARSLSGGEQQRLALIRALAGTPEVLFLDEPTASLDPEAAQVIEELIKTVSDTGVKVILVTHDLGQARRLAHDVIFCAKGQVSEHRAAGVFFDAPETEIAQKFLSGKLAL